MAKSSALYAMYLACGGAIQFNECVHSSGERVCPWLKESGNGTRPPAVSGFVECTIWSRCRTAVSNLWVGVAVDLQCLLLDGSGFRPAVSNLWSGSGCRPAVSNVWGGSGCRPAV